MLATLTDPILPIFAILGIGYLAGRRGWFDQDFARVLNRFVFFIAQPALVFLIVSGAPFADLPWRGLGAYFIAQITIYAGTAALTRFVFKRDIREAILLGMTCAFVNHVFYVLPIAQLIYGDTAAIPIAGVIAVDIAVLYCGTILLMDILAGGGLRRVAIATSRNPALIAIGLGLAANLARESLPPGLFTYAEFVGRAAPPASLFSLGIVMAAAVAWPFGAVTWTVVGIKIALHPLLALFALSALTVETAAADILLLVSAGPCGAMAFVIALQYGVRTETLARAILISTVLSVFSLAWLTA
jgi:predicted permease